MIVGYGASDSSAVPSWVSGFAMAGASGSVRLGVGGFLQAVQEIRRALRVGRGAKDRPLVVLQDLDPRRDISGVIVANLRRQIEVGGKKGGAKLGDQLFHRVALVAETLPPEIPVEARRVPRPV